MRKILETMADSTSQFLNEKQAASSSEPWRELAVDRALTNQIVIMRALVVLLDKGM